MDHGASVLQPVKRRGVFPLMCFQEVQNRGVQYLPRPSSPVLDHILHAVKGVVSSPLTERTGVNSGFSSL